MLAAGLSCGPLRATMHPPSTANHAPSPYHPANERPSNSETGRSVWGNATVPAHSGERALLPAPAPAAVATCCVPETVAA